MTPFLQLRYWLRQAPATSKAYAAASVAIVIALVTWAAVPGGTSTPSAGGTSFSPTAAATSASSVPDAGPAPVTGTESGTPAPRGVGPASSAGPDVSVPLPTGPAPTSSPVGVQPPRPTATSLRPSAHVSAARPSAGTACAGQPAPVRIGVVLIEIGQGGASLNGTFGVPSSSEQRADYNAAFDAVNKAGGAACHPLVGDFQTFNFLNPSTSTTACDQFVQDKVFAIMGGFLPQASDACLVSHKLPTFETTPLPRDDVQRFYPYLWSASGVIERTFVNFAHGMSQAGYFSASKKFTKLGIFYRTCIPNVYEHFVAALKLVGITDAQITKYSMGCPSGIATPADDQAAVTQFQGQGVSTVIPLNDGSDIQGFTRVAQTQGFHPQYLIADTQEVAVVSGTAFAPDQQNFDGAIAVTAQAYGSIGSNLPQSDATNACDKVMASHGLPTVRKSGDEFAGAVCAFVSILVAAMDHDPDGSQAGLVKGIQAVGKVELSEPEGPADYSKPGTTTGGEDWRTDVFSKACACWKVLQDFQPSFPDAG